ncbi:MAG TPA: hypothetical protein VMG12_10945 [Polyangiaceae bacterium]|nr:hypothetical protein [Polyangiaceae bacterium]
MLASQASLGLDSVGVRLEIQNAFDIRAENSLELELRLDRFNDAVGARGGRVLAVSRGRVASGGYFAAVRYCLPLHEQAPRQASRGAASLRLGAREVKA